MSNDIDIGVLLEEANDFPHPQQLAIFFMWFLTILVIITNIPVFVVTIRLKEISDATKITMLSLALTDILLALVHFARLCYFAILDKYYFEDLICRIDGVAVSIFAGVSVINITYLCIDRAINIKFPLRYPLYFTKKVVIFIQVFIWSFVTLIFVIGHLLFDMDISMMEEALICMFKPTYKSKLTIIIIVFGFIIPVCSIFICAVILHHAVHKQIVQIRALQNPITAASHTSLMSHKRAIRTIFCMVAGYYICLTPIMVLVFIWTYLHGHSYSPTAEAVVGWLAFSNSMFNSLVYLPTMKEYRKIFKQIFIPKMFLSETSAGP